MVEAVPVPMAVVMVALPRSLGQHKLFDKKLKTPAFLISMMVDLFFVSQ